MTSSLAQLPTNELILELARRDAWPPRAPTPLLCGPLTLYEDEGLAQWYDALYYVTPRLTRTLGTLMSLYPRGYRVDKFARYLYPWQTAEAAVQNVRTNISDLRMLFPNLLEKTENATGQVFGAYYRLTPDAPWTPPVSQRQYVRIARRADGAYYLQTGKRERGEIDWKETSDGSDV